MGDGALAVADAGRLGTLGHPAMGPPLAVTFVWPVALAWQKRIEANIRVLKVADGTQGSEPCLPCRVDLLRACKGAIKITRNWQPEFFTRPPQKSPVLCIYTMLRTGAPMGIYCLYRSISGVAALAFAAGVGLSSAAQADGSAGANEDHEVQCLALTIYYEARGEPRIGKLAVGHVVMNRTRSGTFPDDVCDVVREGGQLRNRCQFSWYCDGLSDRPRDTAALRESLQLARAIYDGCTMDPSNGALFFHATSVRPAWRKWAGRGERIGQHMFYRGKSPAQLELASVTTRGDEPGAPSADRCTGIAVPADDTQTAARPAAPSKNIRTVTQPAAAAAETKTAPDAPPADSKPITRRVAPRGGQLTALPPMLEAARIE
jgi:hypothetical protein